MMNRKHIPALDGLRGLAILAVMACHFGAILSASAFFYGYLGVDLFFALSGFLITGILIDTRAARDYFAVFYFRRFLRIFPIYYAFLIAMLVAQRWLSGTSANPFLYFAYLQNWQPGNGATRDFAYGHLWSLAVEEQFYLFWPLFVWLCPPRRLAWACGGFAALALMLRLIAWNHIDYNSIWRWTPFRLDSLCLGALAAVLIRNAAARDWMSKWGWIAGVTGSFWFLMVQFRAAVVTPAAFTAAALTFAYAVYWAAANNPGFLTSPALRNIGKYSYAMYLFHLPLHALLFPRAERLAAAHPGFPSLLVRIAYMPVLMLLVYAAAVCSWRVLEQPFLRLKDRLPYAQNTPATVSAR